MRIISFLGYSGGGKTTAIECVTRTLVRRGYRVGTLKHIHEGGFEFDKGGKDSWRFAKSGASMVVAVSKDRVFTVSSQRASIKSLLDSFRRKVDYLLIEGFNRELAKNRRVFRALCVSSDKEMYELLKIHPKVNCVIGRVPRQQLQLPPVLCFPKDTRKFLALLQSSTE